MATQGDTVTEMRGLDRAAVVDRAALHPGADAFWAESVEAWRYRQRAVRAPDPLCLTAAVTAVVTGLLLGCVVGP